MARTGTDKEFVTQTAMTFRARRGASRDRAHRGNQTPSDSIGDLATAPTTAPSVDHAESDAGAVAGSAATVHVPVMPDEVLELLRPQPGAVIVDGTLGGAGHTALLLQRVAPGGHVLAIDADPGALERARVALAGEVTAGRLLLRQGNFARMTELAADAGFDRVDGVLLDLGLSSDQLASRERGFSFQSDAPLDMRFNPQAPTTAADLVNTLPEDELADVLWRYGEERRSRAIARRIVERRAEAPITRTTQLASLVAGVIHGRPGGIHPATRTFQALRIAVNDELGSLETALPAAVTLLRPGGRLAVISFHSLEDRIVKHFLQAEERGCICPPELPECVCGRQPSVRILTRHPLTASATEVARNPRARSAKLRGAERLAAATDIS